MSNKGRLVGRPTEDAALARCKNLVKLDLEAIINHYRGLYGSTYLLKMPESIRKLVCNEKIH